MQTYTKTVRVGECLGPIDWSYDFEAHGWDRDGACNPALIQQQVARLRELESAYRTHGKARVTRHGSHRACPVVWIGMYDGWPYWRPHPTVAYAGPLGRVERCSYYDIDDFYVPEDSDS